MKLPKSKGSFIRVQILLLTCISAALDSLAHLGPESIRAIFPPDIAPWIILLSFFAQALLVRRAYNTDPNKTASTGVTKNHRKAKQ